MARVEVNRGFKHWMSADRQSGTGRGMSAEASVAVSIACGQSETQIRLAAKAGGVIAEELADRAIADMDQYLFDFMEDSK
jgi:hypothetical protein